MYCSLFNKFYNLRKKFLFFRLHKICPVAQPEPAETETPTTTFDEIYNRLTNNLKNLLTKKGGTIAFKIPCFYTYDFNDDGTEYQIDLLSISLENGKDFVGEGVRYPSLISLDEWTSNPHRNAKKYVLGGKDFDKILCRNHPQELKKALWLSREEREIVRREWPWY